MRLIWSTEDGEKHEVVRGEVTLGVGSNPDCGFIEVLSATSPVATGNLIFQPEGAEEGTYFELKNLYPIEARRLENGGTSLWRLHLGDARLKLRTDISLAVNIPTNYGGFDPATLRKGRLWRWRELLEQILKMADLTVEGLDKLPDDGMAPIGLRLTGRGVGELVDSLLLIRGFVLCPKSDGFRIKRMGEGETVSVEFEVVSRCRVEFVDFFGGVEVVCGRVVRWVEVELEPAALDVDGTVKPLTEVAYLSGVDIPRAVSSGFCILDEPERLLATSSIGHLFILPRRLQHLLPLRQHDPDGKPAILLSTIVTRGKDGPFTTIPQGTIPTWSVLDPYRGVVHTPYLLGRLTKEKTELLPGVVDGEEVGIELVRPRLRFPSYISTSDGHLRFTVRRGQPPYLRVVIGVPDVVEGSESYFCARRFAETLASAVETLLKSAGETVTYAGAVPISTSGLVGRVTYHFDGSTVLTKVEPLMPQMMTKWMGEEELGYGLQWDGGAKISNLNLVNTLYLGIFPIQSEEKKDREQTRLAGRLKEIRDSGAPEIDKVSPFEPRNFKHRRHAEGDEVWALRLLSDDRHAQDHPLNRSTPVLRLCDDAEGDVGDVWRVRAIPSKDAVSAGLGGGMTSAAFSTLKSYRTMWLINRETAGEGGWLTDVPPEGLNLRREVEGVKTPAPPRHIAQIGDIVILTDDDTICRTRDGDLFTRANIRHDAHFHLDRNHDGRIHFTTTPPGTRVSTGWSIIGEMVCDPALANQNSGLQKESGQWCPQITINAAVQPVYPLGTDMTVTEYPDVLLPLEPITNASLSEASLAETLRDTINTLNRLNELINNIFSPDLGE